MGQVHRNGLRGRALAQRLGFCLGEATVVATLISELARNLVQYVYNGAIVSNRRDGTTVTAIKWTI
jgi:anti-sigma regulatory factor (Ser/Thr protein kinase)